MIAWLRSARGLATLLAVSVAANLFLGGVLAGRYTGQAAKSRLEAILAPLPEEKRALVREEYRAARSLLQRDLFALQAARTALAAELVKPEPDPGQLDRHFADVQIRSTAVQAAYQQAFKRAAVSLTGEERRAVVDALARRARSDSQTRF